MGWTTTSVQTEIAQQPVNGLPGNVGQTFTVSRDFGETLTFLLEFC